MVETLEVPIHFYDELSCGPERNGNKSNIGEGDSEIAGKPKDHKRSKGDKLLEFLRYIQTAPQYF